ncbi:hypothetical protein [Paenibacillus sp. P46E]|uniref:hypothetical protein n=1 Tax=Paenibacillus sp. P46E TaxID=1349436 RepID=UPI00093A1D1B|nr:hypothetical protein [Paenibacillus sp. P46E]OKP93556.1 hypothetical protein A3849_30755 [Paenibacillus sp. P46E]
MTTSIISKYKNIESYFKDELGIRLVKPKGIPLAKLELAKEKLLLKSESELRVLKADANSLGDWVKAITILFTVLGLVFTMTTSVITSTNESYDAIDNSITDAARDLIVEQIRVADDPVLRNKQIGDAYNAAAKIKRERIANSYTMKAVVYLMFIFFLLICLIYFNFIAKKSFALSNIINETLEEKKVISLLEKELKKENEAQDKQINQDIFKEKVRIEKLRQERLNKKYSK